VLIRGYWIAEGGQSATGALLHHILTTHPAHPAAEKKAYEKGLTVFEYLNKHLEMLRSQSGAPTISFLARHIFCTSSILANAVYPDFAGNRSPLADSRLRGTIHGLTLEANLDTLALHYYATIEAIGLQTRQIIEALNNAGHSIRSIFMSGGQCKNALLTQTISKYPNEKRGRHSCTGLPVVMPYYIESAVCLGSAMLGVKAASERNSNLWGTSHYPTLTRNNVPTKQGGHGTLSHRHNPGKVALGREVLDLYGHGRHSNQVSSAN
jgi:D-ribulokinase